MSHASTPDVQPAPLPLPASVDLLSTTEPIAAVGVHEHATLVLGALNLMSEANSKKGFEWAVGHVPEVQARVNGNPAEVAGNTHRRQLVLFLAARQMLRDASGYEQLVGAGLLDQADADLQEVSNWKAFREKYLGPKKRSEREDYRSKLGHVIQVYTRDI